MRLTPTAALVCLALLAACGDYPEPFLGNPGRAGAILSLPPSPRLSVSLPTGALLADAAAGAYATDIAAALDAHSVPAIVGGTRAPDWRLSVGAELHGQSVVPVYAVLNPKGVAQGSADGAPIPARAWQAGDPATLRAAAQTDAPAIAALLDRIKAAVQRSDPNSLVNRPARLQVLRVTGAPGDGNAMLRRMMVADLADLGIVPQDNPRGIDYVLAGNVRVAPAGPGQQRVEIQWTVRDLYGAEAGHLLQLNDIPAGTLDRHWGDVAVVVAQEAAGGVREVLVNQTEAKTLARRAAKPVAPAAVGR